MVSDKTRAGEGGTAAKASPPRRRAPRKDAQAAAAPEASSARTLPVEDLRRPDLGLRPLGGFIPRLTRPAFKRRSPAGALLMADWAGIVGPSIAAVTIPRRLTGSTLTIGCSGPVAMELQHLAPQLIARVNAALGSVTVEALRFVQQAPSTPPAPRPRPTAPLPDTVRGALDTVGSPELRDALARLARGVYRAPPK
ncbi:DUF721 domain-containing protein [Roseomonas xinghualingensis]|uniref:DUF721 domain-containing protein n=1 Tax=Roseomonas xinghualingensis TaxID=2986475 RepID=UPI0021F0DEEA|nr:DUF721 domain-containing protein [Roseomonas sp. SXEYE001]MCV4208722.1 DUF721 domain-containing protein [Roseomonas sp. SXEYE001]